MAMAMAILQKYFRKFQIELNFKFYFFSIGSPTGQSDRKTAKGQKARRALGQTTGPQGLAWLSWPARRGCRTQNRGNGSDGWVSSPRSGGTEQPYAQTLQGNASTGVHWVTYHKVTLLWFTQPLSSIHLGKTRNVLFHFYPARGRWSLVTGHWSKLWQPEVTG